MHQGLQRQWLRSLKRNHKSSTWGPKDSWLRLARMRKQSDSRTLWRVRSSKPCQSSRRRRFSSGRSLLRCTRRLGSRKVLLPRLWECPSRREDLLRRKESREEVRDNGHAEFPFRRLWLAQGQFPA